MKKKLLIFCYLVSLLFPNQLKAEGYWLVIGSYRQGPGGKPAVSGITSPTLHAIPMDSYSQCREAGQRIFNDIYKPVWNFDNRWTCVKGR